MRPADVKRLMDAMAAAGVTELELEQVADDGVRERIRLVRPSEERPALAGAEGSAAEDALTGGVAESAAAAALAEAAPASRLVDVVAPIVGTYYATPAPDAGPYVKVGDRVQVGTVLCIIEAMKLMNEIEAEVAGTVAEVLVNNEDPVEYGQVLFRIDPG
jgi:acetyl-CoA carboxylase biotin carboxyl carrier protein